MTALVGASHAATPADDDGKRGGRLHRVVVDREASAECLQCAATWDGPTAIIRATAHGVRHNHITRARFAAAYVYVPTRPNGPQIAPEDRREALRERVLACLADQPGASASAIMRGDVGSNVGFAATLRS